MTETAKPKVILLVEDDPDIASIMELLLEEEGYYVHILQTIDPGKAVKLEADLIVMDQKLNGGLGTTLCKNLKESVIANSIPVLLCSAAGDISQLYEECHADDFISKPFVIDEFIRRVNALIN